MSICKCFQNFEMKSLSLSEMISSGNPFSQYHLSKKMSASCSAERLIHDGIICMSEFSRSVKVMIESKPLSMGKGPIKSIATESPRCSGMGRGWRGPNGLFVRDLFR